MELYKKLLTIRKAIQKVPKSERNQHFGYNYVTSETILAEVREKMNEVGVLLVPRISEYRSREVRNQILVEVKIEFMWINVENPEEILLCEWRGIGIDPGERCLGKALTYAEKYFLIKFFQIPTPDDEQQDQQEQQKQKPKFNLPDITKQGWENTPVPFQKAEGKTWKQLAEGAIIANNQNGLHYLHRLAGWEAEPEVAKIAQAALERFGKIQTTASQPYTHQQTTQLPKTNQPGWENTKVPGMEITWKELAQKDTYKLEELQRHENPQIAELAKVAYDTFVDTPPF